MIHYTAEGKTEFKVLVFIPARKPFSLTWEEPKGLKLYIQRVLIMDSCEELLPPYLRFVRGRGRFGRPAAERLARNAPAEPAAREDPEERRQATCSRALEAMKNTEYDKYVTFYKDLGVMLKEGVSPRLDQPREARRPAAVRVDEDRARQVHDAGGVRRGDAGGAEGHLLPDRRDPRDDRASRRSWKRSRPRARTCCC